MSAARSTTTPPQPRATLKHVCRQVLEVAEIAAYCWDGVENPEIVDALAELEIAARQMLAALEGEA